MGQKLMSADSALWKDGDTGLGRNAIWDQSRGTL